MRLEAVTDGGETLALILYADAAPLPPGLRFLTAPEAGMQVATMRHPAGHRIAPHAHRDARREVYHTQEVMLVKSGWVAVTIYTGAGARVAERRLRGGDAAVLLGGGHGFEFESETEAMYCKLGPYQGAGDKVAIPAAGGV